MMPRPPIKRERIYRYYVAHIRVKGYAPTLQEAANATDSNPRYVSRAIARLVNDGRLAYHPRKFWRGVVLPSDERSAA